MNRCSVTLATCARCRNKAHNKDKRTSSKVENYHCEADHQVFTKNCPKFKRKTEVIQIQTEERASRLRAIRKLPRLKPNPGSFFLHAIKNNSNPTISKLPTSFEQESQSDSSSEDTSETNPRNSSESPKIYDNFGREKDNSATVTNVHFTKRNKKKKGTQPPHF